MSILPKLPMMLAAAVLFVACGRSYEPLHEPPECAVQGDLRCPGSPWPEFTLEEVNLNHPDMGGQVTAADLAGQVTVMSLFAGW